MKNASIRDIANNLDLSVATISMAINGTGNISDVTRKRVLAEARRLKYLPSRVARELKEGRKLIGVFSQKTYADEMSMQFVAGKLRGICNKAAETGYDIMLFFVDFNDSKHEDKIWNIIEKYSLIGIISLRPIRPAIQKKIHEYNIPHVAINWLVNLEKEMSAIATDISKVLECAVSHFYERGRRNMAYVHWFPTIGEKEPQPEDTDLAVDIISEALIRERQKYPDMKINPIRIERAYSLEQMRPVFAGGEYDSFFFIYNKHGFWYLDYAKQNNIKVPEDVSVMIYDYQDFCDFITPKPTGIRQSIYELGELGCEKLISIIEGREKQGVNVFLDPIFVPGETT